MRCRPIAVFPTYVLTLLLCSSVTAWAAKELPAPTLDQTARSEDSSEQADPEKRQAIDIAPAPKPRPTEHRSEFFYKYRNELSPLIGIAYDTRISDDKAGTVSVLSMRYHFATADLTSYEVGAELLANGTGAIAAQKRWNYSRTRFRPYTALGAGIRIVPADQVATLLKYEHYQARASAGLEYLTYDPISLRADVTGIVTLKSLQAQVLLGGVWAW